MRCKYVLVAAIGRKRSKYHKMAGSGKLQNIRGVLSIFISVFFVVGWLLYRHPITKIPF